MNRYCKEDDQKMNGKVQESKVYTGSVHKYT